MADNSVPHGLGFESYGRGESRETTNGNAGNTASFNREVELIMFELGDLLVRKHQDYGPKNISDAPGGAINGLLVRMHDKMERLEHLYFHRKTDTPNYESVEDTLKDLANYAIIGLMVQRGQWEGIGGSKISE